VEFFSRTLSGEAAGSYVRARPAPPGTGLLINGVPVRRENVAKADARVDLGQGPDRSLIVEHVTGPVKLLGLTDLIIEGIATPWDFMRPEHRLVYSTGQSNSFVVGPPDGRLNPDLAEAVLAAGISSLPGPRRRRTVAERVRFEAFGGCIELLPAPFGAGLNLNFSLGPHVIKDFHLDPQQGLADLELLRKIVNSPTPFLIGWDDPRSATHAIGDVCGDLAGVGGFTDLYVEARLNFFYHALTIGAARAARHREGEI